MLDKDFKNLEISGIDVKKLNIKDPCIKKILPVEIVPGEKVLNPYSYINYPDNIGHACYDREVNAANIREIKDMYEAKIQIDGNDIGAFHTKFYFDWASGFVENNLVHHCRSDVSETSWTKALGTNNNLNTFYKLIKVDSESYQLQRCYETGQLWDNKYYDIDTKYVNFSDCAGMEDSNTSYFAKWYKENSRHSGPDFIIKKAEPKIIDNSYGGAPIIAYTRPAEIYEYANNNATKAGKFVGQFSTDYGAFYFSYKDAQDLAQKSHPTKIAFQYKGQDLFKGKMDVEIIKKARDKCDLGEFKEDDGEYTFFLAEYDRNCTSKGCNSEKSSTKPVPSAYSTTFTSPAVMSSKAFQPYDWTDVKDWFTKEKELEAEISELKGQIENLKAGGNDEGALNALKEKLQQEKKVALAQKDTKISELKAEVKELRKNTTNLEKAVKKLEADLQSKEVAINKLDSQITDLNVELANGREEVKMLSKQLRDKERESEYIKGEQDNLQKLVDKLADAEEGLKELNKQLTAKKEGLRAARDERDTARDEIDELREELKEAKNVEKKYNEQLQEKEESLTAKKTELQNALNEVEGLREKLEDAEREYNDQLQEKDNTNTLVKAELEEQLKNLEESKRSELEKLKQEIAELKAQDNSSDCDGLAKDIQQQLQNKESELIELQKSCEKDKEKLQKKIESIQSGIDRCGELEDVKEKMTEQEEQLNKMIGLHEKEKQKLQEEIDDLSAIAKDKGIVDQLKQQFKDKVTEIEDLNKQIKECESKTSDSRLSECNQKKEELLADLTNKIKKLEEKEIAKLREKINRGKDNDTTGDNGTDGSIDTDDPIDNPKYVFGYTNKYGCTKFISPSHIDFSIEDLLKKYSDKVITPKSGNVDNCYALEAIKCAYDDSFYQDPMYLY